MSRPPTALFVILATMMLLALTDMPYGYYMLLRLVAFAGAAWLGAYFWRCGGQAFAMLSAIVALLYNPFLRVALSRDNWAVSNVVTACFVTAAYFWAVRLNENDRRT